MQQLQLGIDPMLVGVEVWQLFIFVLEFKRFFRDLKEFITKINYFF